LKRPYFPLKYSPHIHFDPVDLYEWGSLRLFRGAFPSKSSSGGQGKWLPPASGWTKSNRSSGAQQNLGWQSPGALGRMVEDDQVAASVAGLSLRRLHDLKSWQMTTVSAAFSRHMSGQEPQKAGAFLEGFLSGGSEVILQDQPLLQLMDAWISEFEEKDFVESLPRFVRVRQRIAPSLAGEDQTREARRICTGTGS
jgi:Family of unknown function (DUF5682)